MILIVAAVLIALGGAVMVLGGGQHGPGRHLSSAVVGGPSPGAGLTAASAPAGNTVDPGEPAPVGDLL